VFEKYFRKKCAFCKGHKGFFHSVGKYGIYGDNDERYFYHPDCLERITEDPEKHDMRKVDMAILIHDLKEKNLKDREVELESMKERRKQLKEKSSLN